VSYFGLIGWILGIPDPAVDEPQLGVLWKVWPDEVYENTISYTSPSPTDEELVMDDVVRTVFYLATNFQRNGE
jgi:hypothetical protein